MFNGGTFSDGEMFSDGMFWDGMFCMGTKFFHNLKNNGRNEIRDWSKYFGAVEFQRSAKHVVNKTEKTCLFM